MVMGKRRSVEEANHRGTETQRREEKKEQGRPAAAGPDRRLPPLFLSLVVFSVPLFRPPLPDLLTPPAPVCYVGGLFALPSSGDLSVPRTILAFNGDLESRLALHWLVHERGYDVLTLSINLGQEVYLEPLGELALELGATAAQVIDGREAVLPDFALPVLQADAVYQTSCFLGSALARYLIARELVRVAHEEGCVSVAHGAASKGNDQVRMEAAIAAQDPTLEVLAPVRQWNLATPQDKLNYARRRRLPIEEPKGRS